jgi:hypothetical protein
MKKGLLTVLLASLVLVGCQNYDDQFDDLNAQISALKSQVDGLSSLTGQVSSLSGSLSGLQAGVSAAQAAAASASSAASSIDLTGLSASLATLQAEVAEVKSQLATASTATAVSDLEAKVAAIQVSVQELLDTSNVYNQSLTISSASTLDAANALGNNINIVNGSVTITQSSTLDAAKLQSVIDKIFTVTGNFSYTASNTNVTPMTFDKLASAGDVTLKVNGPISAKTLVTAATVTLDDSYISKVTSINLDMLSSVTEIQTDSGGTDNIVFTSATDVQLGALASYPGAGSDYGLTITTKADATLDIGSLDDVKTDGTAAAVALTLNGPKDVTISNMTAYAGSLDLTNIENATITGFKGAITVNGGVENITMTDVEDFALSSATGLKSVTLDVDKASDPALTATQKAPSAYAGAVTGYTGPTPDLSFTGMSSLTTVTLTGFYDSLSFDGLANLTTVDLDVTTGDLTINNNDNLNSLDVTGSEIGNVTVTNNDGIATVELDHTTDLNFNGATTDRTSVSQTITGNSEMTSLTSSADKIKTLNLTSNAKLATINYAGLTSPASTTAATVDVYSNALVASQASDTTDGLTQYSIDGTNDATDLGSYTSTSGMATLKTYLTAVAGIAAADAAVHFDTVQLHNIAADAAATGETAGDQNSGNSVSYTTEKSNDITLVFANTASTLVSGLTGAVSASEEKMSWLLDLSVTGTKSLSLTIDATGSLGAAGTEVMYTGATNGVFASSQANANITLGELTSSLITTRATNLGVTLTAALTGNSVIPAVVFSSASSDVSGSNGEAYTDAEITSYGDADGYIISNLTSFDLFTMTIGGNSVTASIVLASGKVSATHDAARNAVALALTEAWNLKYGKTGVASATMSFWGLASTGTASGTLDAVSLKSSNSGSRAYGEGISITHAKPSSATVSNETSGAATFTFMDWTIGATAATTDNNSTAADIILTIQSNNGLVLTGNATLFSTGVNDTANPVAAGEYDDHIGAHGLTTTRNTTSGNNTGTSATQIYPTDAGVYGGVGDVERKEAANEGVTSSTGSAQVKRTRLHWLG